MRPIQHLGLLVSSALAVAAMATSLAWAGDRYGPTDGYASSDYGYQASDQRGRADCDGRDGCRGDARQFDQRRGAERIDSYGDGGWDRHAEQGRMTYDRRDREQRGYSRERFEDAEQIDPCARQYNLIGHQCLSDGFGYDRGGRAYQDRSSWRAERVYGDEGDRGSAYDRFDDRAGYVGGCEEAHARLGEHCPFERHERFERSDLDLREHVRGQERVVWVEERLPEEFFFGDGGVGPGIVDFGGGGGGGGGFVSVDSFASANSSANASAMSSAKAMSMNHQMMMHQMMQMHHYPSKMHYGGGGCGCKK